MNSHRRSTTGPQICQPHDFCRDLSLAPVDLYRLSGFSIVELTAVLLIAGVLYGMVSGLYRLVEQTRLTSAVNNLVAALHLARSEGIVRRSRITLCQSDNGIQCGSTDRWERGWIIFNDLNNNYRLDQSETVIRIQQALSKEFTARWRGSAGSNHHLSYLATGGTNKVGTFTFCYRNSPGNARTVILYRSGRFRTSTKKANGKPPDCPDVG